MSRRLTIFTWLLFFLLPLTGAQARVWVVQPDGTGDAPTIQAAIDSLYNIDDIVELADGVFTGEGNRDLYTSGKAFLMRSQSGDPTSCIIDLQGTTEEWHWGIVYTDDG